MDIREKDFPLYLLLLELGQEGVEYAIADFEAARDGGDEEKYRFALGIQTIPIACGPNALPGQTQAMTDKTLQSCLAVFEDIGGRGHPYGAYMAAYFYTCGHGCAQNLDKADEWLAVGASTGANSQIVDQLRSVIAQKRLAVKKQRPSGGYFKF